MPQPLALVIEDNPDQALVFSKALEVAGYTTEVIADGAVAQKRLTQVVPDAIVLDLHLPNISGDKLLMQIRSDARLSHARILLATADATLAEKIRGQADFVLIKPVSFAQLSLLAKYIRTE